MPLVDDFDTTYRSIHSAVEWFTEDRLREVLAMAVEKWGYIEDLEKNHMIHQMIRESCKEIEGALSQHGDTNLSSKIFAAELPLLEANAQVCKVKDGYLVLFNTGLFYPLLLSALIANLSFPRGTRVKWMDKEPPLTEQESAQLMFKLLTNKELPEIKRISDEKGSRSSIAMGLTLGLITFALAHEYGHAYLQEHPTAERAGKIAFTERLRNTEGLTDDVAHLWANELLTDQFAFSTILAKSLVAARENKASWAFTAGCDFAAPLYLFALEELITRISNEVSSTTTDMNRKPFVDATISTSKFAPLYVWANPVDKLQDVGLTKSGTSIRVTPTDSLKKYSSHPYPSLRAHNIRYSQGIAPDSYVYGELLVEHLRSLESHIVAYARRALNA